jgi:SAM-dependent methyltransferase
MPRNLLIRRVVPSTSMLTYNAVARRVLDAFDVVPRLAYREFRDLPPNHLRIRVGVGNRLFANQVHHLRQGDLKWFHWLSWGWVSMTSDIVELGVGCGRYARHIRDVAYYGTGYSGSYLGIDIDAEALEWCRRNFDERFEFAQSTHASSSYRNDRVATEAFRIPRDDASVDFLFGISVFSHLLEDTANAYLVEGARILRPGSVLTATCFCVDLPGSGRGDRQSFPHRLGRTFVQSRRQPTAAVAYRSSDLVDLALDAGFAEARIEHDPEAVQSCLVCIR